MGLTRMQKKKGYVSEEGLERLAQRIGLDCLVEDVPGPDGRKMKTLIIAGSHTQIDIVLDNNIVQNVSLTFPDLSPTTSQHMEAAEPILLKDLKLAPGQSPLTKTLDKFADNLQKLAALDKLSIMPSLDCRQALIGIYTSLDRLHKWDISKVREQPGMGGATDAKVSMSTMCTRNGRPKLHARGIVGLALQYWKEYRFVPPTDAASERYAEDEEKVWSLLIGCAPIDGLGIPPVRMSDNWLAQNIVKEEGLEGMKTEVLDWQEPPNILLPASEDNKDAGMEMLQPDLSTRRVPQVMFTVTFDPPIILAQSDWARLYQHASLEPPTLFHFPPPTFDQLFFPLSPGVAPDPSELRQISRRRNVRVFDKEGKQDTVEHHNSLYIYKQIYSQRVSSMPFSHPKQLIEMLPLLRQYAFISTLLQNSFGPNTEEAPSKTPQSKGAGSSHITQDATKTSTVTDDLAAFMEAEPMDVASNSATLSDGERMDVILWVHPMPRLEVVFPFGNATGNIRLQILHNAVVQIVDENVITDGRNFTKQGLGQVLEHMEDLCKWVEWIRTRLA